MKIIGIFFIAAALALACNVSAAYAGMYVSGNLAAVMVDDSDISYQNYNFADDDEMSFDTGIGATAAFGYAWTNGLRVEGELGGRFNEVDEVSNRNGSVSIDDVSVSSGSIIANGFYNFMPEGTVSPFVGAGVGFATVEIDYDYDDDFYGDDDSEYDTVLAYQLAAGVSFNINEHFTIDVQYRYFATDDPDLDEIEIEYTTQNVMAGLRYNF